MNFGADLQLESPDSYYGIELALATGACYIAGKELAARSRTESLRMLSVDNNVLLVPRVLVFS